MATTPRVFESGIVSSPAGAAVPAGAIGESRSVSSSSAVALVGSSIVTLVEDTLPVGIWLCFVCPSVSVSANGGTVYTNATIDSSIQNEYPSLLTGATGQDRQVFPLVVASNGSTVIKARAQCTSTVTGSGNDSGAHESYIRSVRIA